VLIDRRGQLDQPAAVLRQFKEIRRGEELDAIRWGIAQRLQEPGGDQHRNIMGLTVEKPGRLLGREPGGQLSQQCQKSLLILFHGFPFKWFFLPSMAPTSHPRQIG
jgi:hypothetical protein